MNEDSFTEEMVISRCVNDGIIYTLNGGGITSSDIEDGKLRTLWDRAENAWQALGLAMRDIEDYFDECEYPEMEDGSDC